MDLINKIEETRKEMEVLSCRLENLEKELYHNQKIFRVCNHKKVYKYVLEKTVIYTCKKCRNNLQEEETKESKIKTRSFI